MLGEQCGDLVDGVAELQRQGDLRAAGYALVERDERGNQLLLLGELTLIG